MSAILKDLRLTRTEICRLMGIGAMLVWAIVLLTFYVTGRVEAYIRPEYLRTSSLLAGLGLLALSIFNLRHLRSGEAEECCGHDHHHEPEPAHEHHECCGHDNEHDHGHDHSHEDTSYAGNGALLCVMVIPMLAAAMISQDRFLSAATIRNKGFAQDTQVDASRVEKEIATAAGTAATAAAKAGEEEKEIFEYTLEDLEKVVQRSPEGNLMLTVDQLFYTAGDAELQRVLKDQAIEAVGQVIPETEGKKTDNRLRLFILMVSCCAADAQPISVALQFQGTPPPHKDMDWVKVSGTMLYPTENGQKQAVIKVKKMEPTKEPANDLLY